MADKLEELKAEIVKKSERIDTAEDMEAVQKLYEKYNEEANKKDC